MKTDIEGKSSHLSSLSRCSSDRAAAVEWRRSAPAGSSPRKSDSPCSRRQSVRDNFVGHREPICQRGLYKQRRIAKGTYSPTAFSLLPPSGGASGVTIYRRESWPPKASVANDDSDGSPNHGSISCRLWKIDPHEPPISPAFRQRLYGQTAVSGQAKAAGHGSCMSLL